ncbi:MAG: tetratricopeptide repeat protein [Planctomycetota bacterium]|nr:tetratricopeptide repeat protein [Planctomycetota bacterium]
MPSQPTGTVTFLFTDIEGSTQLWDRFPLAMEKSLKLHDEILRRSIEGNDGHVFKTVGDAFCAAFDLPQNALNATISAQHALKSANWEETGKLAVRMALHTGTAEVRDGDYFGQQLNRVARLLSTSSGSQIVISLSTEELIRDNLPQEVELKDLGSHRLKDLIRPEQVFQVVAPGLRSDFPPLASLESFPHNLPIQLSSFIGREREIEEILERFATTRLLTLTGPGGSGKTRLALQLAAELIENHPDGAWFADLSTLTDGSLLAATLMNLLGIPDGPGETADLLSKAMKSKRQLIILDNCEQIIESVAQLADQLLQSCPDLTICATSREGLGITGEHTHQVLPLSLPTDPHVSIETLSQFEAVRLFIERAVSAAPGFTVTNENAPSVAQICVRLDGIPLAIELAASRVRHMAPEQIDQRLDDRFRLLTSGSRTASSRQKTLRGTIDWSWELLDKKEALLLSRVSIFSNGWVLAAAETVCTDEQIEPSEVLDLLASLGDKSLVIAEPVAGDTRFRLLETIREYGLGKLTDEDTWRARHLDYLTKLAQAWNAKEKKQYFGDSQFEDYQEEKRVKNALLRELDNLRSAWTWGLAQPSQRSKVPALVLALARSGIFSSARTREVIEILERCLDPAIDIKQRERAYLILLGGTLLYTSGDFSSARHKYDEALRLSEQLQDPVLKVRVIARIGRHELNTGTLPAARDWLEKALQLSLSLEKGKFERKGCLRGLNEIANLMGDHAEARKRVAEADPGGEELYSKQQLGSIACHENNYELALQYEDELAQHPNQSRAASLLSRANITLALGDCSKALEWFEQAEKETDPSDWWSDYLYRHFANIYLATGKVAEARKRLRISYDQALQGENDWYLWGILYSLGSADRIAGDVELALERHGEALRVAQKSTTKWGICWGLTGLGEAERARGNFEQAIARFDDCIAICRELGTNLWLPDQLVRGSQARMAISDADGARAMLEEALALYEAIPRTSSIVRTRCLLAQLASSAGQHPLARSMCEQALASWKPSCGKWSRADALGCLATIERDRGDLDRARQLYRDSLDLRDEIGDQRGWDSSTGGWVWYIEECEWTFRTPVDDRRDLELCEQMATDPDSHR